MGLEVARPGIEPGSLAQESETLTTKPRHHLNRGRGGSKKFLPQLYTFKGNDPYKLWLLLKIDV